MMTTMMTTGTHRLALLPLFALTTLCCTDPDATPPADTTPADVTPEPDTSAPDTTPSGDIDTITDLSPSPDTGPDTEPDAEVGVDLGTETDAASDTAAPPERVASWCRLQHPPLLDVWPGAEAGPIFGRVYVAGVTDAPREDNPEVAQIEGELGLGTGDDPASWQWTPAVNARTVDNDHELEGQLTAPTDEGVYRYAFRVRAAPGAPWRYCDRSGGEDFDPSDAGVLTVVTPRVAFCVIQHPRDPITVGAGQASPELYGRVYHPGLTGDGNDGASHIAGEVGYGPAGTMPDESWTWSAGAFNVVVDNGIDGQLTNDEHVATFTPAEAGAYHWAWRFRILPYDAWRYCDTDPGSADYQPAAGASLTVEAAE